MMALTIMAGSLLGYLFDNLFKSNAKFNTSVKSNVAKYSDYKVTDFAVKYMKVFEGYDNPARYVSSEERARGIATIGHGCTFYCDLNGNPVKIDGSDKVRVGQTLSYVKSKYGLSSMSDNDFADYLMRCNLKGGSYDRFARVFDTNNVPYYESVADVLIDFSHTSGSPFGQIKSDYYYKLFLEKTKTATSLKEIAILFGQYRYTYYKLFTGQWPKMHNGWMRRCYLGCKHIAGQDMTMSQLEAKIGQSWTKLVQLFWDDFNIRVIL